MLKKSLLFKIFPTIYNKPSNVSLFIGQGCNSMCPTCDFWKYEKQVLPKKVIFKFVDEITSWLGPMNFFLISIGEPLMNKDIFDIVKYIHTKKGRISISTNGLLLDKKTVDRLVESGVSNIQISINGITSKVHDSSRGVPGNLGKIFEAVSYIKEKYSHVSVNFATIILKQNLNEIVPLIKYTHSVKSNISFQPLAPTFDYGHSPDIKKELWPNDIKKVESVFKKIKKYQGSGYDISTSPSHFQTFLKYFKNPKLNHREHCNIGYYNLILDKTGDVKLCDHYPPLGSIKDNSIKKLWYSKSAQEQRKRMQNCPVRCPPLTCYLKPNLVDFIRIFQIRGKRIFFNRLGILKRH